MIEQLQLFEHSNPLREFFKRETFASLPKGPGIYWMTDENSELLYIGKAKNLRHRLRSYRTPHTTGRTGKIRKLLSRARRIHWMNLESEAAALKEEMRLIKHYSPPCNTVGIPLTKKVWLTIGRSGSAELRVTRSFHCETPKHEEIVFGPFSGIPNVLLFQTALVRRLWAIANESIDFPAQLLRNVSASSHVIEFDSEGFRDEAFLKATCLVLGCEISRPLQTVVLPEEEPSPFAQSLWRMDDSRLEDFFRRRKRVLDSVASCIDPF